MDSLYITRIACFYDVTRIYLHFRAVFVFFFVITVKMWKLFLTLTLLLVTIVKGIAPTHGILKMIPPIYVWRHCPKNKGCKCTDKNLETKLACKINGPSVMVQVCKITLNDPTDYPVNCPGEKNYISVY